MDTKNIKLICIYDDTKDEIGLVIEKVYENYVKRIINERK